jgi:hypothetical protein
MYQTRLCAGDPGRNPLNFVKIWSLHTKQVEATSSLKVIGGKRMLSGKGLDFLIKVLK